MMFTSSRRVPAIAYIIIPTKHVTQTMPVTTHPKTFVTDTSEYAEYAQAIIKKTPMWHRRLNTSFALEFVRA